MNKNNDIASELLRIIDQETKELFGEKEAEKLRKQVNERLKEKGLQIIKWDI